MYPIGEFSYLCETTIKTLRHYHEIGLLEPAKIDTFTGYRHYDDSQVEKFKLIKELQKIGLSLEEIKELIEDFNPVTLEKLIVKLEVEKNRQINSLKELLKKNPETTSYIEFIPNQERYFIGKFQKLKNRTVPDLNLKVFSNHPKVFINYEKNYKEENILCFIGYEISKEERKNISEDFLEKEHLEIIFNDADKIASVIHATLNDSLINTYQDIIKFASKNKIQIRGEFYEIKTPEKTDIYVEAYDLKVENPAAIKHQKYLEENLKDIYPEEFIGTWNLQGEIIELPKYFDSNNSHFMPDTKLVELKLNPDGTTNFPSITWKEHYLIIKDYETTIYDAMHLSKDKKILTILINSKYTNARPYTYFYIKKS